MREVVIISGKGGAGKTSLAGAFAKLVPGAVLCDYDVDTPDLHILLEPETKESHEFWSGHEAIIQAEKCTDCGRCFDMCRFEAVEKQNGKQRVNSLKCEGCKVCVAFCPEGAISFEPKRCGDWYVSETRFGIFVHARLYPGEENSGLLVNVLKKQAQALAKKSGADFILSDGTPGLGCSVISSLRGAHLAVTVTEPTPSGRHDFERVAELCDSLKVPVAVLINKCDLNTDEAARIKEVCRTKGYACIAELPFEPLVTQAMMQKKVVTELPETIFSGKIAAAWDQIAHLAYASR